MRYKIIQSSVTYRKKSTGNQLTLNNLSQFKVHLDNGDPLKLTPVLKDQSDEDISWLHSIHKLRVSETSTFFSI